MMDENQILVRRLRARALGRAVPVRQTRDLSPDPAVCIGISTIKIVTEEHVQALAFGSFTDAPQVIARIDPLGRDATDLEPFAEWLIEASDLALQSGTLLRLWIPHGKTLETLDVLGHRYERNAAASLTLQRMGQICRVLAREARHQSQQAVAIASDVLRKHVVTGQSPAEDAHLGALLAWINPPDRAKVANLALARAIEPASGVLANHPARRDDERVELLRRRRKASLPNGRARFEEEIARILHRAALDEWALLEEARRAFWQLPLQPADLEECIEHSRDRVLYGLEHGPRVPKNAVPRIRDMAELEHSKKEIDQAQLEHDAVVRSRARAKGRCLLGTIVSVEQRRRGYLPCSISVATAQRELRFRRDDKVVALGTNVVAKVCDVTVAPSGVGSIVTLSITSGVRSIAGLANPERPLEWVQRDSFPLAIKLRSLAALAAPWMLTEGAEPPAPAAGIRVAQDPLSIAERHLCGDRNARS